MPPAAANTSSSAMRSMFGNVGYPTFPRQGRIVGYPAHGIAPRGTVRGMDTLGKRLRRLRDTAGINQADAAAAAGIGRPHLSKIEADKDPPSLEVLARLAVLYRVPLAAILPKDHELSGAEVITAPDEVQWLQLYRRLPADQARALLAAMAGTKAA